MYIFLIVPWGLAAGLAYWKMETNASYLKKVEPNLAADLENDADGSKRKTAQARVPDLETQVKDLKAKVKVADETLKNDANDSAAQKEKKNSEESLVKLEQEVAVLKSLDKNDWMPVMSFTNIAWTLGIFFGVGIIGHLITKQILKMFFGDKRD